MLTYLIIYLGLGLILRIFGPMAQEINSDFMNNSWKRYFSVGFYSLSDKPPFFKIIILEVLLSTAEILLWPIFLTMYVLKIRAKKSELAKTLNFDSNKHLGTQFSSDIKFFYLDGMKSPGAAGEGVIKCRDCLNEEKISISTHSRDNYGDFVGYYGFQCQSCGNFESIANPEDKIIYSCDCGGVLSRDNKVFCRKCRSHNVEYRLTYIT